MNSLSKLKPRQQAWLDFYLTTAKLNATEAAKLAGYQHPSVDGPRLRKQLKQVIEQEALRREENLVVQAREVMILLSELARDKSHKDQLRAIEALAKIHGLMDSKLTVELDHKKLVRELELVLRNLAPMLDIQPTPSLLLPASTED